MRRVWSLPSLSLIIASSLFCIIGEGASALADPPEITLRKGFNLVSIPEAVVPYGNLSNILQALGGGDVIERAYTFNPSNQTFYESWYDDSGQFHGDNPSILSDMDVGGIIVYSRADVSIPYLSAYCSDWNLRTGINIVGTPCAPSGTTAFQILAFIGGEGVVSSIQRFDHETGSFITAGFRDGELVGDDFLLTAGEGYFIMMQRDVVADPSMGHASITLPPDPAAVSPEIDPTVATSVYSATSFLYTGSDPIQTGVAPGTIELERAAVVRGKVTTREGQSLPGVTISVLNHPELGQTLSRADGMFDMAVNGGGLLIIDYQKTGYLPAQRQLSVPWQDHTSAPDVALVPLDSAVTAVDLNISAMQVGRGSLVTDINGTRQATVLFPPDTQATMTLSNGSTQPVTTLHVRATEYTIGQNGPQAMPAELPPNVGYTYAVELSIDEALAAGAVEVRFNSPLPFYVENFLDFPVGIDVPLGSYDRVRGEWIASDSGRVILVLGVTGGLADLDITGDGAADDSTALAALSITDAERAQIASLYQPGQGLWRVLITHFSPWDCNWGIQPPDDAVAPEEGPDRDELLDDTCPTSGSIIECQNQILGEAVGVVGTPLGLHYQSERVPGRKIAYQVNIPLSGSQVPDSLRRIELVIQVAGQLFQQGFGPAPNQRTTFTWDGRDVYGRPVQGSRPVTVRIGYTYGGVYQQTSRFGGNGIAITGSQALQEVTLWRSWQIWAGTWDARAAGLGGWTLSVHHAYDPGTEVLYRGDGGRQSAGAFGSTISTFAGTGISCITGVSYDVPATQANICPGGLAVGPDGSLFITHSGGIPGRSVLQVAPDGIIRRVVGNGPQCLNTEPCGDGGPATEARFYNVTAIAIGPDSSLYIGDAYRVRRVGPDGIITTVAGTGVEGFTGDGGPSTQAQISYVFALAVGPDGSLYLSAGPDNVARIRRVGTDGIITTVAGNGAACISATDPCGDGGPATLARLNRPNGVAVGPDGSLYISDVGAPGRVRRVTPDGIIHAFAGTGGTGFSGDGGPATEAKLTFPRALAVGPDDTVYIVDSGNFRVRVVRNGIINTLAGTGVSGTLGDGGPSRKAQLRNFGGLAVGPDESIFVAESSGNPRVRRIEPVTERIAAGGIAYPARDGSEIYLLTQNGQHLKTLDALTGALLYEFTYDGAGRLSAVTDGSGNLTAVERDAGGNPVAIIGPFGQHTMLELNPDGYLERIASPIGEAVQVDYTPDGLLTGFMNPRGYTSVYGYDALGRLTSTTDATGATRTLMRNGTNKDYTVTLTAALGRATAYRVESLSTGDKRQTVTDPAGIQTRIDARLDGTQTAIYPDGTTVNAVLGPDPRWRMRAPVAASVVVTTPGGKVHTMTKQRAITLVNASDILSLRTINENVTINGRVFTTTYDNANRTFTLTSPAGRRTTSAVDDLGRLVQSQFWGFEPRSFTYDPQGRLSSTTLGTDGNSRTTSFSYGVNGFLDSMTDAIGRVTTFAVDVNGRIIKGTFPDGRTALFSYDTNGNITTIIPPGRTGHTFGYTELDQASLYTAPVVGSENSQTMYSYNIDRQLINVGQPDGGSVHFQQDDAGRLSLVDIASGDRSYNYDAAGRLSTLGRDQGIALTYAYDGGLPTGTTWSGAVTGSVTQDFDNNFRIISRNVNGGSPIAFQYDQDGLLSQAGVLVMTRNAQNGLITGTSLGAMTDVTTYDTFGALETYSAIYDGNQLYSASYTVDSLGRFESTTEAVGGSTRIIEYAYDLAGRLSEVRQDGVVTSTYTYDANGNRLSRTNGSGMVSAVYDAQDRLIQYGNTTYEHTPDGELQKKTTGGQITTYQYDSVSNLTGVTLPSGTQIGYLLDGRDRRIGRQVDGVLTQAFLYQDGLRPVAELDSSGNVVSRFVYGVSGNVPDYFVKNGVTYRIIADHLGSPRLVINIDTGQITQRMDYDEFGNVTVDTNPGFQPFGFAGGLYDAQTGLVHFGAREYDPETGRWTIKDPIGFGGGDSNLYTYIFNNPVVGRDPSGLKIVVNEYGANYYIVWIHLINLIINSPTAGDVIGDLLNAEDTVEINITYGMSRYDESVNKCFYNPSGLDVKDLEEFRNVPPEITLAHELIHAYHDLIKSAAPINEEHATRGIGNGSGLPYTENKIRMDYGLKPRNR